MITGAGVRCVLRVVAARFERPGLVPLGPFDVALEAGARRTLRFPDARSAAIAARICAAIVKPTEGAVFVGDYDARLQPAQAKRLVGFVPSGGFTGGGREFRREARMRADVWEISRRALEARLDEAAEDAASDPLVRALRLALLPPVSLLVFERAAAVDSFAVRRLCAGAAVLAVETERDVATPSSPEPAWASR